MPTGACRSLAVALAALALGCSGARAGQSAGSWTDPPARPAPSEPRDEKPAPRTETPAAQAPAQRVAPPEGDASRANAQRRQAGPERRRAVASAQRRAPARPAPRMALRTERPKPATQRSAVRRSGPRIAARPVYDGPMPVGIVTAAEDSRLEHLRSAEAAGYLVVRRRTLFYPGGRTLRLYRAPVEEDEAFD